MSIAASAPGKVLLAGGYLVLDRNYSGLVFALNARIHAISTPSTPASEPGRIVVKSPQFSNAVWTYQVSGPGSEGRGTLSVTQLLEEGGSSKNPFVETTIRYVLSYLAPSLSSQVASCDVTILADNDYYSQPPSSGLDPPPRFNDLQVPLEEAHKTGLGSSAALVTSLTACLLSTYSPSPVDLASASARQTVHNLSQAAHCAAQGKVGSGFDVAAAVFGSCVYRRFTPTMLDKVGEAGTDGFSHRLRAVVDDTWDQTVRETSVPRGVRVVMGDVDCGSATPGMVKSVLKWRAQEQAAADALWDALETLNAGLIRLLDLGNAADDAWALAVSGQIRGIRKLVRGMGMAAGVAIEPEEQTALLDAASDRLEGVLGAVVPGAGGYDAVAFLVKDDPATIDQLKAFLNAWGGGVKARMLEAREEREGVRSETVDQYRGIYGLTPSPTN